MSRPARIVVLGSFPPARLASTALSAALVRALKRAGRQVLTAARAEQGRAEVRLPRNPRHVAEQIRDFGPDLVLHVESRCPEDRQSEDGFIEELRLALKNFRFGRELAGVSGRVIGVTVAPDGADRLPRPLRETLKVARRRADSDPEGLAGELLAALGIEAPAPWSGGEPEPACAPRRTDAECLRDCLARYDFSRYLQIRKIAAHASEIELERPSLQVDGPRTRIANALDAELSGPWRPVTRYMRYARAALNRAAEFSLADNWGWFRYTHWFATEAPGILRGGTAPLPDEVADILNADAGMPWDNEARASRFMAYEVRRHRPDLLTAGRDRELARWWMIDHAGPRRYLAALTPDHVRETAGGGLDRGAPFPLSRLVRELHAGSDTYPQLYDIDEPCGRIAFIYDLMLNLYDTPIRRQVFEGPIEAWFRGALDEGADSLSRFEFLTASYAGALVTDGEDTPDAGETVRIREWFRRSVCGVYPRFRRFSSMADEDWFSRDRAFELVGMAANDTGLGANLWMSEQAFAAAGIRPRIRDSERGFPAVEGRSEPAGPAPAFLRKAALVHLNADVVPQVLCHPLFDRHPDLYAIAFLLWELEVLPECHLLALDLVDEAWCPSSFLTDVYRRHTDKPVLTMKKGVEIPDVAPMPKTAMGVPEGSFCFLISFDFHSSVERKNPLAAVRAFQRAFAGEGDGNVRLIIKTTEVVPGHWGDPADQWGAISAAAERDPRIQIIADKMPFTDFLAMIRGSDCLVSSHRAEGFGYLPAYGLIYERPVIATDYSGSSDFITPETAFPVRWTPRDVAPHEAIFPVPGAFWADADIDAMAAAMRLVHDRRDEAAARAAAGRQLMAREYSIRAQGERYLERLRAIGIIA